MANEIKISLGVDDKGSAVIRKFSDTTVKKVRDMATRSQTHLGRMQSHFKKLGTAMSGIARGLTSLKAVAAGALMGWGVKKIAGSFMEAARTSEQYKTRLTVLLGSVEEGNKLFKEMADYAGKVPFEYEKIMASATQLSGVMRGGVAEISQWMPMIGDLAAATGLDIEKTTEQVIRMYSAGAGAADLFREKGVLGMMGFKAGVSYTAEETRRIMMENWNKAGSQFKGATDKLAKTWDGMMTVLKDAWFTFRKEVMDAGIFDTMKHGLHTVLEKIKEFKASGRLDEWAHATADKFLGAMKIMIGGVNLLGNTFSGLRMIWEGLWGAFSVFSIGVAKGMDKILGILKKGYEYLIKYYEAQNKVVGWIPHMKTDTDAYKNTIEALGGAQGFAGKMEQFWNKELQKSADNLEEVNKKAWDRYDALEKLKGTLEGIFKTAQEPIVPKVEIAQPELQLKKIGDQWHITQGNIEHTPAVPQINKSLSQTQLNSIIDDWARAKKIIESKPARPKVEPQIVKSPPVPWAEGIMTMQNDLSSLSQGIQPNFDMSGFDGLMSSMRFNLERATHHEALAGPGGPVNVGGMFKQFNEAKSSEYRDLYNLQKELFTQQMKSQGRVQGDITINVPESAAPQSATDWRHIVREYIKPELEKLN
jgi:hypothetical protein